MLDREDTPWYSSARLLRQLRIGEWEPVFTQVGLALRELAERRGVVAAPGY
jgi:hypothetical protein